MTRAERTRIERLVLHLRAWSLWRRTARYQDFAVIRRMTAGPTPKSPCGRLLKRHIAQSDPKPAENLDDMIQIDRAVASLYGVSRKWIEYEYIHMPDKVQAVKAQAAKVSQSAYSRRLASAHRALLRALDAARIRLD